MNRLSENAMDILNTLHTERLAYESEYVPIADALCRLAEYEDMEEQGLLIKLPCKIGDAVYRICRFKRGENWKKEAKFIRHSKLTRSNLFRIMLDGEFGKTVFLTLEEAEKALEAQHLPKEEV